ncbi:hypothetical protein O181_046248 [Austropuccinia psidii MF-1]|uniref:Uncharacterized protein n=1 Tax=Austropuccinia psidii MF-1 TaxID=1389203 RepID=A0A9Q3DTN2_9BASI|nr:hypothetical protein [Austropuccinia psidii MF-1]
MWRGVEEVCEPHCFHSRFTHGKSLSDSLSTALKVLKRFSLQFSSATFPLKLITIETRQAVRCNLRFNIKDGLSRTYYSDPVYCANENRQEFVCGLSTCKNYLGKGYNLTFTNCHSPPHWEKMKSVTGVVSYKVNNYCSQVREETEHTRDYLLELCISLKHRKPRRILQEGTLELSTQILDLSSDLKPKIFWNLTIRRFQNSL